MLAGEDMARRIAAFDWASTPIGPRARWPQALTTLVDLMLATPQMATLAVGPERTFLYNDHAARHYGTRRLVLLGLPLAEAFPHEFNRVAPFYDRVFAGESVHVPAQPLDPAQTHMRETFDACLTPVRGADGTVIASYMTGVAIGDRLRAEAKLRADEARPAVLLKVGETLRTISDPGQVRLAAMQVLGEQLGLARIYYFDVERDAAGGWIHIIEKGYQRDPAQTEFVGPYALSDFNDAMFEGFARGEALSVEDTEILAELSEEQCAAYRAIGVRAFINVPLLRDGDYAAGIGAHDIASRVWSEAEIDLIREVVARAWTASERATAETALGESEERLRQFGEASQDVLWTRDAETLRWTYLTPAFEKFTASPARKLLPGKIIGNGSI